MSRGSLRLRLLVACGPLGAELLDAGSEAGLRDRIFVSQPGVIRRLDLATLRALGDAPAGSDPVALLAMPARHRIVASDFAGDTLTAYAAVAAPRAHTLAPGPRGTVALSDHEVLALDYRRARRCERQWWWNITDGPGWLRTRGRPVK